MGLFNNNFNFVYMTSAWVPDTLNKKSTDYLPLKAIKESYKD